MLLSLEKVVAVDGYPPFEILHLSSSAILLSVPFTSLNDKGEAAGTHVKIRQGYSRSPRTACIRPAWA